MSADVSVSQPGKDDPADRIVNQHNLMKETAFTSSLFRAKALPGGRGTLMKDTYQSAVPPPSSAETE